eukprot:1813296-Rhodomonas_salina.1
MCIRDREEEERGRSALSASWLLQQYVTCAGSQGREKKLLKFWNSPETCCSLSQLCACAGYALWCCLSCMIRVMRK